MKSRFLGVLLLLLSSLVTIGTPHAERRAFSLGINQYPELTSLTKSVSDTKAVAAALSSSGFDVQHTHFNLSLREFDKALEQFLSSVDSSDELVIFLSGHGFSNGEQDFFAASDGRVISQQNIDGMMPLDSLFERLSAVRAVLKVLIIDACRNVPLANIERVRPVFSKLPAASTGMVVVYSTGLGEFAFEFGDPQLDTSAHSLFVRELLPVLTSARGLDRDLIELSRRVSKHARLFNQSQHPAFYYGATKNFFFRAEGSKEQVVHGDEIIMNAEKPSATPAERYRAALLLLRGDMGLPKNPKGAVRFLENAASNGHALASFQLGYLHKNGLLMDGYYIERDLLVAEDFFVQSISQPASQWELFDIAMSVKSTNNDRRIRLLTLNADAGHAESMFLLGKILAESNNEKARSRAYDWFVKALNNGIAAARQELRAMCINDVSRCGNATTD